MVPLDNGHVTIKEYSSKNVNSRFYVGTSDFFHEIQEKLVPKTFPVSHVTVREYSSKIRKAALTLEQVNFSLKSKKNLFPKLFLFVREYSSKIRKAAFTLEQVIFSLKSKKNLFPKLFRRDAWFH